MPRESFKCYYNEKTKLYRKRIKDSTGKYISLYDRDKNVLKKKHEQAQREVKENLLINDNITVAEYAVRWYQLNTGELSYSRKNDYKVAINNYIAPAIGHMKLKDVQPDDVRGILVDMSKMSFSSQQKVVIALRQIFKAAEENQLILRSPCLSLKVGGYKAKEKVPLTDKRAEILMKAVSGTQAYVFIMIGLFTGLRREEILGLKWDCIELEVVPHIKVRRTVTFENNQGILSEKLKSKSSKRDIPIPPILVECLKSEREKSNSEYVCPDSKGNIRSRQSFRKMWDIVTVRTIDSFQELGSSPVNHPNIIRSIDFHVTSHILRHTYITNLCRAGMNVKKIQYLAGHANVNITLNIYTHVTDNKPEDIIGEIEKIFEVKNGANINQ